MLYKFLCAFISLLLFSHASAKLEIVGKVPDGYQLFDLLKSMPKEQLDGYHELWITALIDALKESEKSGIKQDCWLFARFTQSEAGEILRPILAINGFGLKDDLIMRYFKAMPVIELEEKIRPDCFAYLSSDYAMDEIFNAAQKVFNIAKGSILLVLGQTPAYLGHMVKEINKRARHADLITIVEVPISGKPDAIIPRVSSDKQIDRVNWVPWHWTMASFEAIVTRSREQFFRGLLKERGFEPSVLPLAHFDKLSASGMKQHVLDNAPKIHKKVFILDNSRGPSVASFLLLIVKWFNDEQRVLPDLYFINMDAPARLDFCMNKNLEFKIDTYFLSMDQTLLNIYLDQIDPDLRIVPSFAAQFWNQESYQALIKQYPKERARLLMQKYTDYVASAM